MDTARFLWKITSSSSAASNEAARSGGELRRVDHATGELLKTGIRMGVCDLGGMPGLWTEGRPIQIIKGERGVDELMPARALPDAEHTIRQHLGDLGIDVDPLGLSRLDLTATGNKTGNADDRSAILRGVAALDVPRRKTETIYNNRTRMLETVAFIGKKGAKYERIYAEALTHSASLAGAVRFEAQTRHKKESRRTAEQWSEELCAQVFHDRFQTMARASSGVVVASTAELHKEIRERIEAGTLTPRKAMRLLGYIELCAADLADTLPKSTRNGIAAELREAGLVQSEKDLEGRHTFERYDLGRAFEEIANAFSLN